MFKLRKLSTLYTVLYEHLENNNKFNGLCSEIRYLQYIGLINQIEFTYMMIFLDLQKPRTLFFGLIGVNKEFTYHPTYSGRMFWWGWGSDTENRNQRKLFVQHLINKTKSWYI